MELRQKFSFDAPRQDGILTKQFFIDIHALIYKYKKYGMEMISEANFQERICFLEECEELKEEAKGLTGEQANSIMHQAKDLSDKYQ